MTLRLLPTTSSFVSVALAAISLSAVSCSSRVVAERTMTVERDVIELTGGTVFDALAVDIRARNGSIQVRADESASQVLLEARLKAKGRDRAAAEVRVEAMEVQMQVNDAGVLEVRAVSPGDWKSGDAASFTLVVPSLGSVVADTSNGKILLDGGRGDAELSTSNGSVTVTSSSGALKLESSNGRISVENQAGSVDAETSNGSISVSLAEGDDYGFELETSNGSVTVEVPTDWSGAISASTSNGRVRVTEPGGVERKRGKDAELEWGVGGERSKVNTSNGSISIRAVKSKSL